MVVIERESLQNSLNSGVGTVAICPDIWRWEKMFLDFEQLQNVLVRSPRGTV